MTWGEFKKIVDSVVNDEAEIDYIDASYPRTIDVDAQTTENGFSHFTVLGNP